MELIMTNTTIKYPEIEVNIIDYDGNAFFILAKCRHAAMRAKLSKDEVALFMEEARSGDYNHLLQTCMRRSEERRVGKEC